MFDIGWSEFVLIAVVALIAIGPKELPGVLRMVGQWIGKARKMASEFQGQFQEALREAEMADLKKSFDEVRDAARGFSKSNILTSLHNEVSDSLRIDDKPTSSPTPSSEVQVTPTAPEASVPQTAVEADAETSSGVSPAGESQHPATPPKDTAQAAPEGVKDAKAS